MGKVFSLPAAGDSRGSLADEFFLAPFSVLSAREGFWCSRKAHWLGLGIHSEAGRAPGNYGSIPKTDYLRKTPGDASVFDPVLAEACYRWFCPPDGQIIDPFAGGSVRGIVAHSLGYRYWGCDLRPEQIGANRLQADQVSPSNLPEWVCADALDAVPTAPEADFVFSCPPYGDLEKYSDDPRDLSTMEYHRFIAVYKRIILRCWKRLRPDRFACFVVGEFRDRKGFYRNFVGDTIKAFYNCGFSYYNEIILLTQLGSLPMRVGNQFRCSRKIGKTHQNVLVFVKGDPRRATKAISSVPLAVAPETIHN